MLATVEASERDNGAEPSGTRASFLSSSRVRVFGAAAFALIAATALALTAFGYRVRLPGSDGRAPTVPTYAYPLNATKVEDRTFERQTSTYRRLTFTSRESATNTYDALIEALNTADWFVYARSFDEDAGSFSFRADSTSEALCTRYHARPPVEAPADETLSLIIVVDAVQCE